MSDQIGDFVRVASAGSPGDALSTRAALEGAGFTVITPGFSDAPVLRGGLRNPVLVPILVHRDMAKDARQLLNAIAEGRVTPLEDPMDRAPAEEDQAITRQPARFSLRGLLDWLRGPGRL